MAEVVLEHVSKTYPNGVTAVRDLDLRVGDGELLVLVGPSGSGKTTTLRLIGGLEATSEGTIAIDGHVVNDLPPRRRDVALVSQRHALYPHLNVRDNLAFGFRMRNQVAWWKRLAYGCFRSKRSAEIRNLHGELQTRVLNVARMLGLEGVLDRLPDQLSGGQQQRTALGRAMVRQPAVVLLDEPLSDLDAPLRAAIRGELHLLHRRIRGTMIHVTHDQAEALAIGDRVAVLNRGTVQQVGTPAAVYDRPCNRFVAEFIGWPPMNLLEGCLMCEDGQWCFGGAAGKFVLPNPKVQEWISYNKRDVLLGIRPEDVHLGVRAEAGPAWPIMEVIRVETTGGDSVVRLGRGKWRVSAKTSRRCELVQGEAIQVSFDMHRAHLFDRISGLSLGGKG